MIIKKDFYKEIYFIDSPEHLTDNQWNNLLMSGKMNWDKYFTPFKTKREHEVIKNVELIWLDSENAMRKYLKRLNTIRSIKESGCLDYLNEKCMPDVIILFGTCKMISASYFFPISAIFRTYWRRSFCFGAY